MHPRTRRVRPLRSRCIALSIGVVLALGGCLPADPELDAAALVEHVWRQVDTRYALFADKPDVDWPAALDRARAELAVAPTPITDAALFDIVATMLSALDDQHVNLASGFDVSGDLARSIEAPRTYDADLVERRVLARGHRRVGGALYAVLDDGVGYLRLSGFDAVPAEGGLDVIFAGFADARGLIVDLRSNGGGSLEAMFRLLARLVDRPTDGIRVAFSAGPGHDDLTPPEPRDFDPSPGPRYTGPLVVLVDGHTYSAANTFAFVVRRRADVTVVGQPTAGGGGLPRWLELPNGWLLRLSTGRMTDPDGAPMEPGLAPDVPAAPDPDAHARGRDSMIDAARASLPRAP